MTATDSLPDFLALDPLWRRTAAVPSCYSRTLSPGFSLEVRDTVSGWLAHLRRPEVERPFFVRQVSGVADLEALTAVLGG